MANIIRIQGTKEKEQGIHYEVDVTLPVLGEGNFGAVRQGVLVNENTGSRREVAIKFLYDDLSTNAITRAQKEASISIVHENLVEMLGFVETDDQDYYGKKHKHFHVVSELLHGVMLYDLLEGKTVDADGNEVSYAKELYDLFQKNRIAFAIEITRNILSGIMALHDHGFIHRDIDPSNVMITNDGKIKLIDLGIAKKLSQKEKIGPQLTSMGDFVGKAAYAAPELVRGDVANQNYTTDIYAVGIMLYQLIVGELPFQGTVHEMLEMQISKPVPVNNIPNRSIREIVRKATEKHQSDRYQTSAEFRVELDSVALKIKNGGKVEKKEKKEKKGSNVSGLLLWAGTVVSGLIIGVLTALCV